MFTPEEVAQAEYLLGIMIQNAKARGLKACKKSFYEIDGEPAEDNTGDNATACCALGALYLDEPILKSSVSISHGAIIVGNDCGELAEEGGPLPMFADAALGRAVGNAFQDAMAEGEDE